MSRVIPAFKGLIVDKKKIVCVSEKPLRYITREPYDFTEMMSRNGFYQQEQLGALGIFMQENNHKTVYVVSEIYVHHFQLSSIDDTGIQNLIVEE
jgi:hypothetical protein